MLLPIVHRELLVAARRRMTYLSRTLSAGILIPLFTAMHSLFDGGTTFAGTHILTVLSTIVLVECMLAGVRYTSDCISEERREGTLGLLFLTCVGGLDVVLGKLFARAVGAFFNLLATFPILALTLFLGGVSGAQITAVCVTLFVCLCFSLIVGAFVSSFGRREQNVLIGTLLLLILVTFVPLAVNAIAVRAFGFYGFVDTLVLTSPYFAFSESLRGFTPALQSTLLVLVTVSIGLLALAAWHIRRTFGESEATPATPKNDLPKNRPAKIPLPESDVMGWLAGRGRLRRFHIICTTALIIAFGFFSLTAASERWTWAMPVVFLGSYALHVIYKLFLTAETCRQLNEDRRTGRLELLLVTPLRTSAIIRSQLFATWRAWFPVMIALAVMNYLWMTHNSFSRDGVIRILFPVSLILLLADTITLPIRSLLLALDGGRYSLTVFKVFFRTMGPPLAMIGFLIAMNLGSNKPAERAVVDCFVLWTVFTLLFNAALVLHARERFREFRRLAAGDAPSSWRAFPFLDRAPSLSVPCVPTRL